MIGLFVLNLLCFVWPLFLTFKLINGFYSKNRTAEHENGEQVNFLLNYWICYIIVNYIQDSLVTKIVFLPLLGFNYFPNLLFSAIKIWLFYNHGCLVINYCYFERILRKTLNSLDTDFSAFELLEKSLLDPMSNILLANNHFIPSATKMIKKFVNDGNIVHGLIDNAEKFRDEFRGIDLKEQSFLQFSLNYVCYMDSTSDLETHYISTNTFVFSIIKFLKFSYTNYFRQEDTSFLKLFQLLTKDNNLNKLDPVSESHDTQYFDFLNKDSENINSNIRNISDGGSKTYYIEPKFLLQNKRKSNAYNNYPFPILSKSRSNYSESKQVQESGDNKLQALYESSTISNPFFPLKGSFFKQLGH